MSWYLYTKEGNCTCGIQYDIIFAMDSIIVTLSLEIVTKYVAYSFVSYSFQI